MTDGFQQILMNTEAGRYECIGIGSARRVYDLNNGYVAKIAKNKKGYAQNFVEWDIYQKECSFVLAKAFYIAEDFGMLIMEKAEPLHGRKQLIQYFDFWEGFYSYKSELENLQKKYILIKGDLIRSSSWGIVENRPVLVDYGFTAEVRRKYYMGRSF